MYLCRYILHLELLFSAVILLVYIAVRREALYGYAGRTWLAFVGLALISTIGGQFVFNLLLKHVPASAVTMSILGEPIGTCILAYLILHEAILPQQLIGILVIMLGMAVFFFIPPAQKHESVQAALSLRLKIGAEKSLTPFPVRFSH